MRGNVVMEGYYNDPEATAVALRGGFFHTGDAAVVHPDGYVEIRDRIKDVIISGGENISSVEVEGVLAAPPGGAGSGGRRHAGREVGRGAARVRDPGRGRERFGGGSAPVRARASPTSKCPKPSISSTSCRRRRPARSRSSCCAAGARRSPRNSPQVGAGPGAASWACAIRSGNDAIVRSIERKRT